MADQFTTTKSVGTSADRDKDGKSTQKEGAKQRHDRDVNEGIGFTNESNLPKEFDADFEARRVAGTL